MKLNNSQRAQISIELVLILTAVAIVAIFVFTMLTNGAHQYGEKMNEKKEDLLKLLDQKIDVPK